MSDPVSGDLLSAASLLATVISVLYSTWYSEITAARDVTIPLHDRDPVIARVSTALWSRAVPLVAAAVLLAVALAPICVDVVWRAAHALFTATPSNWHYDPVQACFVGVFVVTVMLSVLTASATRRLFSKLKMLRTPAEPGNSIALGR